jgi:chitinase
MVGYYFAPTVRNGFPVDSIDGDRLTHVSYAFANIDARGNAVLGFPCLDVGICAAGEQNPNKQPGGNFAELRRLKQRFPRLRTLISIGGWTWSGRFSDVAATPAARRRFVDSAVKLFIQDHPGVFDGIDLDWEYPVSGGLATNKHRPEDKQNYTLLVAEFRRALDRAGRAANRRYELSASVPGGLEYARNFELAEIGRLLDFMKIMAFDYHSGSGIAHFNAPLAAAQGDPAPNSTVRASVDWYVKSGVAKEKLVLGVPFYGYGYGGVDPVRNGLFQPISDSTAKPWIGAIRYHRIGEALRAGFRRHWEPNAGVPWLYDARRRIWITYDDAQSLSLKADLVRTEGLGGIMIWELSGDDGTLLPALHAKLRK